MSENKGVFALHRPRHSISLPLILTYLFAVCAASSIARFDLRMSNTRALVFCILLSTFALASLQPRFALLWALLVGFAVPIAEAYSAFYGAARPGVGTPGSLGILALITLAIGLTGAYIGVFFRKMLRP